MKSLFSTLIISFSLLLGCNNTIKPFQATNPIDELAVEIFDVIKKKDFNAFEKLMADVEIIKKQGGDEMANYNSTDSAKRIFDSFYEKNIDWDKMNITKVTSNQRGREILKVAQVMINFSSKKSKCTLTFPNWLKPQGKTWKIGGLSPKMNCMDK